MILPQTILKIMRLRESFNSLYSENILSTFDTNLFDVTIKDDIVSIKDTIYNSFYNCSTLVLRIEFKVKNINHVLIINKKRMEFFIKENEKLHPCSNVFII